MNERKKFRGCMLGLAIGDALGYPTEFIRSREDILTVTNGKGVTDLPDPAIYTDDTQMTISVAEAILTSGDDMEGFMTALTDEFLKWLKLQDTPEQRRAPGNTCLTACRQLAAGVNWEESGISGSLGCGSAMRSAPIGLFHSKIEKVVDYAINSSKITHPAELALCGSVGTALISHFALKNEPVGRWAAELLKVVSINGEFKQIIREAAEHAALRTDPDFVMSDRCLGEGWCGHEAVASALYCCMMYPDSYEKAVLLAANAVGDCDSIACIAGAWMGARLGVDAIPAAWVEKIENKDGLIALADKLHDAAGYEDPPEAKFPSSLEASPPIQSAG